LSKIESQVEEFLEQEIKLCNFDEFRKQGYIIDYDEPEVHVDIGTSEVQVEVNREIVVEKDNSKSRVTNREIEINSNFGSLYGSAREIYNKEMDDMFLENYGIDVMYNYAPVTGVEISCAPEIWNPQEVIEEIQAGLSANMMMLRTEKNKNEDYFVVELDSDADVSFMYNSEWPTRIEIWPVENELMVAEPVGLEQGMGIIGFCYVPYHFVYDIYYPILIQVYEKDELFQFPVSVIIAKSSARNALETSEIDQEDSMDEFCNYKNTIVSVYTYDNNLNPVQADIDFVCLNQKCSMGETEVSGGDAVLSTAFPQCINGKIVAKAEGYVTTEQYVSTNEPQTVNVLMDKLYDLDLDLIVGGRPFSEGIAIISFDSDENSFTAVYPDQEEIKLSQGEYEISVQVFGDSSLTIPSSTSRQCVETPSSGIGGFLGITHEECFDITIPSQTIDNALIAGGKVSEFILESELYGAGEIEIEVNSFPRPTSLEQLQENYNLVEVNRLGVQID